MVGGLGLRDDHLTRQTGEVGHLCNKVFPRYRLPFPLCSSHVLTSVKQVMNAMRPWAHESDLARYIDSQRAIFSARTPSTPTMPNSQRRVAREDIGQIEQISTALHNLRLRLSNAEELADHAGRLIEYLQKLQADLPIPGPEQAFGRLQPLRDLIFWLPSLVLRAGESDLAALTLLAHLYASALAVEPLFPEIGGAYLGSMSIQPLDRILDILRTRRSTQPHDSSIQVALSLVDVPIQIITAYRIRQQRQSSQAMEAYGHSPQGSPYTSPQMQLTSTSDVPPSALYSPSPLQSPQNLVVPVASFFRLASSPAEARREPPMARAHSMSEANLGSGGGGLHAMQMVYPPVQQHARSSHEMSSTRMDYFGQIQAPYHPYGSVNMNTRFVTPSQLWA